MVNLTSKFFCCIVLALKTGIYIDALLNVRAIVLDALPDEEMYGFTPDAGLPRDYAHGGWGITA